MGARVSVVDYGIGNLRSVSRSLDHCGADVVFVSSPEALEAADRLVLPGVGAFGDCMSALLERDLVGALEGYFERARPFLGICVGMQLLFEIGEEFGEHAGLGLMPGRVARIPAPPPHPDGAPEVQVQSGARPCGRGPGDARPYKVPNVGWSELRPARPDAWRGTPLASCEDGEAFYFVHSFRALPADEEHLIATSTCGGHAVAALVGDGVHFGSQFHPEKSGPVGLRFLMEFLAL